MKHSDDVMEAIPLKEHTYPTPCGTIHYWVNILSPDAITLVFLPGLTADHRLFDKQVEYFAGKYNVVVWDAPAHAASWPFRFDFDLFDKARWLHDILEREEIASPVIVGQSMGGYVGQAFSQLYPEQLKGFVAIDSAPLQRKYVTAVELWLLKRMQPVYAHYPWKLLLLSGTNGVATSIYGRKLMREMMSVYEGNQKRYARIAGHGFRMLAEAMERDLPYEIKCPALLICGTRDRAGSCIRYNKAWHRDARIPLHWVEGAGHNSNTDKPDIINALIEQFLAAIQSS
ncbi:MAG: alpha/beta hydrolase [Bacteroidetes bacterium]|uniref:Alpha/beta hydrolase n=1 Tax=Candidatus Enterocola intestinipullorum TaxID=2840783 RepID=A0A9D9EJC5_9BACT|nr:alpha/beta hydrolase [Candidatus Enterocola intestinipullorum]